jgi:hypothetical protein
LKTVRTINLGATDKEMAIRMAELLAREGNLKAAADAWWSICSRDPYDLAARERFAEVTYDVNAPVIQEGGMFAARLVLQIISFSLPTARLTDAYFYHLRNLLASKAKRRRPGMVVLGLGSGRCGSTTLAHAISQVPDACATHENAPMIYWEPLEAQVRFHIARFRELVQYFAVVFDAAFWWLNARARVFEAFDDAKVIGLVRETESCVASFMKQKGSGIGSLNHWATPGNGVWATSPGDPSLPTYETPPPPISDPDAVKRAMVTRFVTEYNAALERLAAEYPDRVLLVRTEDLRSPAAYARIGQFIGCDVKMPAVSLNVGSTVDSNRGEMKF